MRGNAAGWGSAEVAGALAVGTLLVVAFVACELRARAPMLPLRLFGSRAFSAGNAAVFFWSSSFLATLFFVAQFLQTALGYGPLAAGLRLMPWGAAVFVTPLFAARLMARFGGRPVVAGAGFAAASPAIQTTVLGAVAPQSIGQASGTLSTIRQLGGVFGIAVVAAVFAETGGYESVTAFNDGFVAAIGVCAGLSLLGAGRRPRTAFTGQQPDRR